MLNIPMSCKLGTLSLYLVLFYLKM